MVYGPLGTNMHWKCRRSCSYPKDQLCRFGSELVEWIFEKTGRGSWFSAQTLVPATVRLESLQKIYSPSLQCLRRDIMAYAQPPIVKKDRWPKSRRKLQQVRCDVSVSFQPKKNVRHSGSGLEQPSGHTPMSRRCRKEGVNRSKAGLRAHCLNAKTFDNNTEAKWVLETPYDIRDEVMNDLLKAYNSNFAAKRPKFRIQKRSSAINHSALYALAQDSW